MCMRCTPTIQICKRAGHNPALPPNPSCLPGSPRVPALYLRRQGCGGILVWSWALLWDHMSLSQVGNHIDVLTGKWVAQDAGIGAGVDSYFEYLVKGAILLQDKKLMAMFLGKKGRVRRLFPMVFPVDMEFLYKLSVAPRCYRISSESLSLHPKPPWTYTVQWRPTTPLCTSLQEPTVPRWLLWMQPWIFSFPGHCWWCFLCPEDLLFCLCVSKLFALQGLV